MKYTIVKTTHEYGELLSIARLLGYAVYEGVGVGSPFFPFVIVRGTYVSVLSGATAARKIEAYKKDGAEVLTLIKMTKYLIENSPKICLK